MYDVHFLITGTELHLSVALNEKADCPKTVFFNLTQQSSLTDTLVSLELSLQKVTHCLRGGGVRSWINLYIKHISAKFLKKIGKHQQFIMFDNAMMKTHIFTACFINSTPTGS